MSNIEEKNKEENFKIDQKEILKTDQKENLKTDQKENLKTDQKENLKTDQKEILKTDQKENLKTDQKENLKTDQKEILKTDQKENLKTDPKEILKTDQKEILKTEDYQKEILKLLEYKKKIIKKILKKKIILGHNKSNRNPKMSKYIILNKNNIDIIDPYKILNNLKYACKALKECIILGGIVLFVGTKKQIKNLIEKYAKKVNMPYINYKWPAGLLTNIKVTKLSIKKKKKIKDNKKTIYKYLSKKEKILIERKYKKIKKKFGTIQKLNRLPMFMIIVDVKKEHIAVLEAKKSFIYTIGIVDTDSSPDNIDYPIPANDDLSKSVDFILKKLTNSIVKGLEKRKNKILK